MLPGDGIGKEVIPPCIEVLNAAIARVGGSSPRYEWLDAGAEVYRATGQALPKQVLETCRRADAILLGAMGLPHIRYPDGTELAPQLDLRFEFGLYAGVRPTRALAGVPRKLTDPRADRIDFVIIRESTEGLFASRGKGVVTDNREARDTMVITRDTSERLFDFPSGWPGSGTSRAVASRVSTRRMSSRRLRSFERFSTNAPPCIRKSRLSICISTQPRWLLSFAHGTSTCLSPRTRLAIYCPTWPRVWSAEWGYAPSADIGDEHAVFQPAKILVNILHTNGLNVL